MLMQNEKLSNKNSKQLTDCAKTLTAALHNIKEKDPELKRDLESIKIDNAAEIPTSDNKKCFLVQVSQDSTASLNRVHSEVIKKLESKFSNPFVLVPLRKRINGNLYRRFRGKKVPRTETLSHVYDTLLQDVLYPAVIVGKRVRFPKSRGRVFKVQVDALDREHVEYKLNAITAAYKALTNRELVIEFQ